MKMITIKTMMVSTVVHYSTVINVEESMLYSENSYTYISTVTVLLLSIASIFEGLHCILH